MDTQKKEEEKFISFATFASNKLEQKFKITVIEYSPNSPKPPVSQLLTALVSTVASESG